MADLDRRPLPEVRVDLEMIHQPTSAQDAKPHAALRAILSVQNSLDVGNTRSLVRNPDIEDLRHRCRVEDKFSSSASSVAEGVPRQFRDSSCYAGLVVALKTQKVANRWARCRTVTTSASLSIGTVTIGHALLLAAMVVTTSLQGR